MVYSYKELEGGMEIEGRKANDEQCSRDGNGTLLRQEKGLIPERRVCFFHPPLNTSILATLDPNVGEELRQAGGIIIV